MAEMNFQGFGYNEYETVSADKTLDLTDTGIIQNVTATKTITLPACSGKQNYIIRVGADSITVTISPNSNDKIAGYTAANTGAGADNKDMIFTNAPIGSFVELRSDPTDGYSIARLTGASYVTFES